MTSKDLKGDSRESSSAKLAESKQPSPTAESKAEQERARQTPFEVKSGPGPATAETERKKLLLEELENVDFYINQGYLDVALNTLEGLEIFYPNHPLILERLDRMARLEIDSKTDTASLPVIPLPGAGPVPEVVEKAQPTLGEQTAGSEPADLVVQKPETFPVFDPAIEIIAVDDETTALAEPTLEAELTTAASQLLVPVLGELYESLEVTVVDDEPVAETQETPEAEPPVTNFTAVQNGLQSLFDELEELDDDAPETDFKIHFNVAHSYFDLELFEDAIEELQAAYRSIQSTKAHPRYFQCCMMLARCFRIECMPHPALIWLRRALDAQGRSDEEYWEARYELAGVHEELGEPERALELYEQIIDSAPDYRDVSERIERLRANPKE